MQFAEDGTLKDYLQGNELNLETNVKFNIAILNGLKFLHDADIILRDL
ncbi:26777_t:CDS:1, partial [Dentiscutata erythropus]